ncbi:MAG: hypothetical protein AAGA99_21160 [Actinomycetota bacterium]
MITETALHDLVADLRRVADQLANHGPDALARHRRVGRNRRDGYPTSSGLDRQAPETELDPDDGKPVVAPSQPTAQAAIANQPRDPIADAVDLLTDAVDRNLLGQIRAAANLLTKAAADITKATERQTTVPACTVCEGPADPPRSGMCNACRMAWDRAQRAEPGLDRSLWKHRRKAQLDEADRRRAPA